MIYKHANVYSDAKSRITPTGIQHDYNNICHRRESIRRSTVKNKNSTAITLTRYPRPSARRLKPSRNCFFFFKKSKSFQAIGNMSIALNNIQVALPDKRMKTFS